MNRYQTLGPRILALIVDFVVVIPLIALYIWIPNSDLPVWVALVITPVGAATNLLYIILFHWKFGQTLGKMVAKVKVVDSVSEGPITLGQSCLREIAYIVREILDLLIVVLLLLAGFAFDSEAMLLSGNFTTWPIFVWLVIDIIVCIKNAKNRALHDFIAGTVVVRLDMQAEASKNLEPPGPDAYEGIRDSAG